MSRVFSWGVVGCLALGGCGGETTYDVVVDTLVVDEDGDPVANMDVDLCAELVLKDGGTRSPGCETPDTETDGVGQLAFTVTTAEEAVDVHATATLGDNPLDGEVTVQLTPDEADKDLVHASAVGRFVATADDLPQVTTRFRVSGLVGVGDPIVSASGRLDLQVTVDGTELVSETATISTNEAGFYEVLIDAQTTWAFPATPDTITVQVDMAGFQADGTVYVSAIEGGDPRVVVMSGVFQ